MKLIVSVDMGESVIVCGGGDIACTGGCHERAAAGDSVSLLPHSTLFSDPRPLSEPTAP